MQLRIKTKLDKERASSSTDSYGKGGGKDAGKMHKGKDTKRPVKDSSKGKGKDTKGEGKDGKGKDSKGKQSKA